MRLCVPKLKQQSGLSLIGLMIALMLSALLLSISVPKLNAFGASKRAIKTEALRLKDLLEELSLQASLNQSDVRLSYKPDSYLAEMQLDLSWKTIESRSLNPRLHFELGNKLDDVINFYASGVNSPATLLLKSAEQECAIKISLRGRVTLIC